MKTEKNIFWAFILNLAFSVFELAGGIFTGSVAIISDSIHDAADALSIGISFALEKRSKRAPDSTYTYGYIRYSVLGGAITTLLLIFSSVSVIWNAIGRLITPKAINYNGMLMLAIIGVCVNASTMIFTRRGSSFNQRAVNLHMLEDVLGWLVVLIGAIIMKFTNLYIIDPIISIGVAIFILVNACINLNSIINIFLEKTPSSIDIEKLKRQLLEIDEIADAHHIHVWSIDGEKSRATMHIVTNEDSILVKKSVQMVLQEHKIIHSTLELEKIGEHCDQIECSPTLEHSVHCHHHHH